MTGYRVKGGRVAGCRVQGAGSRVQGAGWQGPLWGVAYLEEQAHAEGGASSDPGLEVEEGQICLVAVEDCEAAEVRPALGLHSDLGEQI